MATKAKGRFIDPMLLLRTDNLPDDRARWEYQLKFDGYRAIAFTTGGEIHLRSRNDNDFSIRLFKKFRPLEIKDCPFVNLPRRRAVDGARA